MNHLRLIVAGLCLTTILPFEAVSATPYSFVTFDVPGDLRNVWGINNAGDVVGFYGDASGTNRAFLFSQDLVTTLPQADPVAPNQFGHDINSSGQVAVAARDSTSTTYKSFLYSDGSFTPIQPPGGTGMYVRRISDNGKILGVYQSDSGGFPWFVYDASGVHVLPDIPGSYQTNWMDVNNDGTVVGGYVTDPNYYTETAFIWSNGMYSLFQCPGSQSTEFSGINNLGDILGSSDHCGTFVYRDGTYQTIDPPSGASFYGVFGLNDLGQVAGTLIDSTGRHGFIATPVPLPASAILLPSALAALGWVRRKRAT